MRELVRTFPEGFGIKDVSTSSDAVEGLEQIKGNDRDLVITDRNMSPVSGLDFVQQIRTGGGDIPNRFVPIIMLTGYTEMKRVEQVRDAGINSFPAKSISAGALYKRLVTAVHNNRQYAQSGAGYFGPDRRSPRHTDYRGKERRT